jgi:hypothetical protein
MSNGGAKPAILQNYLVMGTHKLEHYFVIAKSNNDNRIMVGLDVRFHY